VLSGVASCQAGSARSCASCVRRVPAVCPPCARIGPPEEGLSECFAYAIIFAMSGETMVSSEAARLLGVSVREVQRLAAAGRLDVVRHVGRSAVLDAASVHKLANFGTARGRIWNARSVWAALALLDGRDDVSLSSTSQLWHLRERLRAMRPHDLVRRGRSRAKTIRYRASSSYLDQLARQLTLTGTSAIDTDPKLAKLFGLASARTASVDGYVSAENVAALQDRFLLVRDIDGNVTLHVTDDPCQEGRTASVATVALDLADSIDPRQRAAGLRALTRMMRKL
jgi:excisionase family DNA binding protein